MLLAFYYSVFRVCLASWTWISLPIRLWVVTPAIAPLAATSEGFLTLDYIVDGVLLLDVIARGLYARFASNPCFSIVKAANSRRHLFIDLVTCLPVDLIVYGISGHAHMRYGIYRLNKLGFIFVAKAYLRALSSMTWRHSVQKRRLIALFLVLTLTCHWVACVWNAIGNINASDQHSWHSNDPHGSLYRATDLLQYIRSMYFSCITLSTVGFGDIVPITIIETVFTIACIYIGMTFSCASIANITALLYNADKGDTSFQQELDDANQCMEYRGVNEEVKEKVLAYIRYSKQVHHDDERNSIHSELQRVMPEALRQQIAREYQDEIFRTVSLFRSATNCLRAALSELIQTRAYAPGDLIVREGHALDGLYYIRNGVAHVRIKGILARQMQRGDYIGDSELFMAKPTSSSSSTTPRSGDPKSYGKSSYCCDTMASCTVEAASFCEILWLSQLEFQSCLDAYGGCTEIQVFVRASRRELEMRRSSRCSFIDIATQNRMLNYFHPESSFRKYWSLICLIGLLYNLFSIPRDFACVYNYYRYVAPSVYIIIEMASIMYLIDGVFLIDIYFKLFHFGFMKEGVVKTNSTDIQQHYLWSKAFFLDVLASLPLDLFALQFGLQYLIWFRLNKLIRLVHFQDYLVALEDLLISKLNIGVFLRRLFKSLLLLFVSGYACGSVFLFLGERTSTKYQSPAFDPQDIQNWVDLDQRKESFDFFIAPNVYDARNCYVPFTRGIYFAFIGTSTLGFGDILPVNLYETLFVTVLMLYGAIMKPAVVGGISSLLLHRNRSWRLHTRRVLEFTSLVRAKAIPRQIQDRVNRYYDYVWSNKWIENELHLLHHLPQSLRAELASSIWTDLLVKIPMFRLVPDEILTQFYAALEPHLYVPSDEIVPRDSRHNVGFYIVCKGIAEKMGKNDRILNQYNENDAVPDRCFGYEVFLKKEQKQAIEKEAAWPKYKIVAKTYCEVLVISAKAGEQVLKDQPELREVLQKRCQRVIQRQVERSLVIPHQHLHDEALAPPVSLSRECSLEMGHPYIADTSSSSRFHPDSVFRRAWDVLIFLIFYYTITVFLFRLAFYGFEGLGRVELMEVDPTFYHVFTLDYVFDLVLIIDIILKIHCFLVISNGELSRKREVYWRFQSRELWMDIIAAIPFDLISLLILAYAPRYLRLSMIFCRSLKLIKALAQSGRLLTRMEYHATKQNPRWLVVIGICKVLILLFLITHFYGCIWILIAQFQNFEAFYHGACLDQDDAVPVNESMAITASALCAYNKTWVADQIMGGYLPVNGGSVYELYLRAIYFTLQMLLVVISGDVVPVSFVETCFCITVVFSGVVASAYMIGLITEHILQLDSQSCQFRQKADALMTWMDANCVPAPLKRQAMEFLSHYDDRSGKEHRVNEEVVLQHLPAAFRHELARYSKVERLRQTPIFRDLNQAVVDAISDVMKRRVYAPGDVVTYEGRFSRTMFFFKPGMADVVLPRSSALHSSSVISRQSSYIPPTSSVSTSDVVHRDEFLSCAFGERSLFLDEPQQYTICVADFTDVYILKAHYLPRVYALFPERNLKKQFEDHVREITTNHRDISPSNSASPTAMEYVEDTKADVIFKASEQAIHNAEDCPVDENSQSMSTDDEGGCKVNISYWDLALLGSIFYFLIIVPFRIGYLIESDYKGYELVAWFLPDVFIQIFYWVDFYFRHIVIRDKVSRMEWIIEALTIFPFYALAAFDLRALKFVVAPTLLRAFLLPEYLRRFSRKLNCFRLGLCTTTSRVGKCLFYYVLASHFSACLWMGLHRYAERSRVRTWATEDPFLGGNQLAAYDEATHQHNICYNIWNCYIRAHYMTIAFMSTVGYGDIRPNGNLEYIYRNFEALIGAFLFSSLIASFAAFFQYRDSVGSSSRQTKLANLAKYLENTSHLSKDTCHSIEETARLLWKRDHILAEEQVTAILPIPLRRAIAENVKRSVLRASPFLSSQNDYVRGRLALTMRYLVCCASQTVLNAGDLICEIVFMHSGRVRVVSPSARPIYGTLGDHFGRAKKGACLHTIRAVDDCEMYILDEVAIQDALDHIRQSKRDAFLEELDATSLHSTIEAKSLRLPDQFFQTKSELSYSETRTPPPPRMSFRYSRRESSAHDMDESCDESDYVSYCGSSATPRLYF